MTWADTPTGLTRPSLWDKPGHKKLSLEDETILDTIEHLVSPPRARMRQTTLQTVTNASFQPLTFTTEDYDSHNGHDNAVNTSRYTCKVAGFYEVSGKVGWTGNATGRRVSAWRINGAIVSGSQVGHYAGGASDVEHPTSTMDLLLAVNDYIEIVVFQDSGASRDTIVTAEVQSYLQVRWVGFA